MNHTRLLLMACMGLVLSMGDPSFLPGNVKKEPEFPSIEHFKQIDATIMQMQQVENQAEGKEPEGKIKQPEEKK